MFHLLTLHGVLLLKRRGRRWQPLLSCRCIELNLFLSEVILVGDCSLRGGESGDRHAER